MNDYFFSNEELSHLKYIRDNSPLRIWYEYIRYVFEYSNFYFLLEVELAEKIYFSEGNDFLNQYAMKVEIIFKDEKFVAQEGSKLLFENQIISKIEIVRTKLYFVKHRKISENNYKTDSNQINPIQGLPTNIIIEKTIIVDVGVIIKSDSDRILNLFIKDNSDDFTSTDFYYSEGDFYNELSSKYQFVALS